MTTDLRSILSKLGLAQYIDRFDDEGFETWGTVLDITESDLDALGVKLGHRRVLQREIACSRGVPIEVVTSPSRPRTFGEGLGGGTKPDAKSSTGAGGKRKYRRHPKPDEHAPERPPSAYVIFSNKIRGELKPENLSFTAIAKKVGERWQDLPAEEKEPYELEASSAKEKYHSEMADYKTTKSYREYQQYLIDFKAKNTPATGTLIGTSAGSRFKSNVQVEEKRPRLAKEETQESTASSGSGVGAPTDGFDCLSGHVEFRQRRAESVSSAGPHSTTSGYPSPPNTMAGPPGLRTAISAFIPMGTVSPMATSPTTPSTRGEQSTGHQVRQSNEPPFEQTSPGPGQHLPPISQFDNREAQQLTTHTHYQTPLDLRLSRGRTSPTDRHQRPTRIPPPLQHQQNTSGTSSKSSMNSSLSTASTAPSSSSFSGVTDEGKRTALSLPPLAAVTAASPLSDSASYIQQSSQSLFQPSSAGMKFESLQLPLPHNIAFGQRPLPRSEHEEKLANIFDMQDIPRERDSLKHMTLEQQRSASAGRTNFSGPSQPRLPLHRPALPTLDHSSDSNSQENMLHPNADPLSVLAYAGRLVGRGSHQPPPR